jgi:hypothetical protein
VERARFLSEQRHAVKEYFPIVAAPRLLLFLYGKWTCVPSQSWLSNNANRPILNGGNAIQLYYCGYLTSFVLGTVCVIAAIVK